MKTPDSFVPLTTASVPPSPREFRVAIINDHSHATSSVGGSGVAKASGFQSLQAPQAAGASNPSTTEKKVGEPRVSIQRDGDRVTHLRVQCGCGQILDLACIYDPPPPVA